MTQVLGVQCGACTIGRQWFQVVWPTDWQGHAIAFKEMVPVRLAAAIWGANWSWRCVCRTVRSDNDIRLSPFCKQEGQRTQHVTASAVHAFTSILPSVTTAVHIKGKRNTTADALSRNNLSQIWQAASRRHGAGPGVSGTAGLDRSAAMDGTVQKLFDRGILSSFYEQS